MSVFWSGDRILLVFLCLAVVSFFLESSMAVYGVSCRLFLPSMPTFFELRMLPTVPLEAPRERTNDFGP